MIQNPAVAASLAGSDDTIVAISTPPGKSALAIVRMSGPRALEIAGHHLAPWPVEPRTATVCAVNERDDHQLLDQAVVTTFVAPASFTGEDSVEICTHGGLIVPSMITAALISSGARQALPGEFTRRAVLNGKLDIVQAEAIGDLIDADSVAMQRMAVQQLSGALSSRIQELRSGILELEALIAYDIDFPEEDDGPIPAKRVQESINAVRDSMEMLLATVPAGELIREGALVVIAGEPNAGKSSLFNALIGTARAIVTDIPGTTRDAIEVRLNAGAWPIRLVDTAGLRESDEMVELLGIEVSRRYLSGAHVILACGDSADSIEKTVTAIGALSESPVIRVMTKTDLLKAGKEGKMAEAIPTSAVTSAGLDVLWRKIDSVLGEKYGSPIAEVPMLTRARHIRAINDAHQELLSFEREWRGETIPVTVAAVHLRAAAGALEEMIGAISVDDVLDRVFSSFCVGK